MSKGHHEKGESSGAKDFFPSPLLAQVTDHRKSNDENPGKNRFQSGKQHNGKKNNSFKWTDDGKPVCNFCNKVGHIERKCFRKDLKLYDGNANGQRKDFKRSNNNFNNENTNDVNKNLLQVLQNIQSVLVPGGNSNNGPADNASNLEPPPDDQSMQVFSARSFG